MNVLMVSTMVPGAEGTSAGAVVMHAEVEAVAARHRVTLVTLATPDDATALRQLENAGIRVHAAYRHRDEGLAGRVRRVAVGLRWRLGDEPLRTAVFHERDLQRTLDALGDAPFDVVHVLDNAMAAYALPSARARLITEYEVRSDEADAIVDPSAVSAEHAREAERARWWRYQVDVWSRFDRVQVFTAADAASVERIAPEVAGRVRVNPFGVRVPAPTGVAEDPASLVFVGGFRHPPNVDAAVWLADEILPRVRSHVPAARLTIVGADPPAVVRDRAGGSVSVTGRVASVQPYLESAAVVVAPVRFGGGMRFKVLQAMALARPVVTTTRGAAGVWNPVDAPTLRIADDARGIADHIATLLTAPEDRMALGARARAAVLAHHRPDQFGERLLAIYDELAVPAVVA